MAWLVKAGLFETANLFFLRVGHTHEDIDQLFSILVALILGAGVAAQVRGQEGRAPQ